MTTKLLLPRVSSGLASTITPVSTDAPSPLEQAKALARERLQAQRLAQAELLANIKAALPDLEALHQRLTQNWVDEEMMYRFYHHSFKVFILQEHTTTIVDALGSLAPSHAPLNESFLEIINAGTGKEFELSMNDDWFSHTRPIVEAYHHARKFLDLVIGYGRLLDAPPSILPSGWALVLSLYNLR